MSHDGEATWEKAGAAAAEKDFADGTSPTAYALSRQSDAYRRGYHVRARELRAEAAGTARVPDGKLIPDEPGDHRHPYELMTPPGSDEPVQIDTLLAPLITALWAAGFTTVACCQDLGESIGDVNPRKAAYWKGRALVELPSDSARALAELAAAPLRTTRFPMHWAQDGAWEMSIPVVMLGSRAVIPDLVQVRFPASQIGDLTVAVMQHGRQFRKAR